MATSTQYTPKKLFPGNYKLLRLALYFLSSFVIAEPLKANPSLGQVIAGNATISQQGSQTHIQQTTDKVIIDWASFNIAPNEATIFQQPNSNAIALNRVLGNDPSLILGSLTANGQLILINPAGIIFGAGSKVDVGGLIATTANLSNQDFLANNFHFIQNTNHPNPGMIINNGTIVARDGGLIALVGPAVANSGVIQANLGKVILGSGTNYTLDLYGDGLINFTANTQVLNKAYDFDGNPVQASIQNHGKITANGGKVLLAANTAKQAVDSAINTDGIIEAHSAANIKGEIILLGGDEGSIHVAGTLAASGEHGGNIKIYGKDITLNNAQLNASGNSGGGVIHVGGDYQGTGNAPHADTVVIDKQSTLNASAISQGEGGRIIIWSDRSTDFSGSLMATGGALAGNGGFAEVSGKRWLNFRGQVDLTANHGAKGTLLLDPYDIIIQNDHPSSDYFNQGNYSSNTASSWLRVADLENALAYANVVIQTGEGGNELGNITVNDNIQWANSNRLTLNAHNDIAINAAITNSGGGSVVLRADYTATGNGTVNFGNNGSIQLSQGGNIDIFYNPVANYGGHKYYYARDYTSYITMQGEGKYTAAMLVNNVNDLQDISVNLYGDYALGTHIDASETRNWNNGAGFMPIGELYDPFMGSFNGNGYTIDGLTINRPDTDYVGLFSHINFGDIKSVNLNNVNIVGHNYVGALAGLISNSMDFWPEGLPNNIQSTIKDIKVSGYVEGRSNGDSWSDGDYVGGLAGSNDGGNIQDITIKDIEVIGNNYVGGVVGKNESSHLWLYEIVLPSIGTLQNISVSGQIRGNDYVGGVVGLNSGGKISVVSATDMQVVGNYSVGALAGSNEARMFELPEELGYWEGLIQNAIVTGYVTGESNVGGLVGTNSSNIENALSTVAVNGNELTGGLVGEQWEGSVINSFWNVQTSGQTTSAAGIGKTTAELMQQDTYTGWDFDTTWGMLGHYPYLLAHYTALPPIVPKPNSVNPSTNFANCLLSGNCNHVNIPSAKASDQAASDMGSVFYNPRMEQELDNMITQAQDDEQQDNLKNKKLMICKA